MGNMMSFRKEFGLIVVGALIFTASFLWKDLVTDIREEYFPQTQGMLNRFLFTIVVTVVIILGALYLRGFFGLTPSGRTLPTAEDLRGTVLEFDDSPIDGPGNGNGTGAGVGNGAGGGLGISDLGLPDLDGSDSHTEEFDPFCERSTWSSPSSAERRQGPKN